VLPDTRDDVDENKNKIEARTVGGHVNLMSIERVVDRKAREIQRKWREMSKALFRCKHDEGWM
tara:strand:- start:27864 stop:28052 length:189 start_codon:yes stop_codon:yes gene_type:complete